MNIIVGMEPHRPAILTAAAEAGLTIMVSANALWQENKQTWNVTQVERLRQYPGDVVLDSGGFVAMSRYGGRFRFTAEDYLELVRRVRPLWYASMDFCCEPELRLDNEVRIADTVARLQELCRLARTAGLPEPVPVIQGYEVAEYRACFEQFDAHYRGDWPQRVAIGTLCRRPGREVAPIVDAVAEWLPVTTTDIHLFGVKGTTLAHFRDKPRISSIDSMAWNYAARRVAHRHGVTNTNANRIHHLFTWLEANYQRLDPPQRELFN
jgi:hypothetical protein